MILFVDMVGSTELKYRLGPDVVFQMMASLYQIVRQQRRHHTLRFTGDGAMLIFDADDDGRRLAAYAALEIMRGVEVLNTSFVHPAMQVRIGIATGDVKEFLVAVDDVLGKPADIAARLCAEADPDEILMDDETWRALAGSSPFRAVPCNRRLSLKGVPPQPSERFWTLRQKCLLGTTYAVRPAPGEIGKKSGLLALYPDRDALSEDFRPARIIRRAAPGSEVVVAGRTLISWAGNAMEMLAAVRERGIRFMFVLSRPDRVVLDSAQRHEIADHWPGALRTFRYLVKQDRRHFDIRVTKQLLLDGVTCARLTQPPVGVPQLNTVRSANTLIALQDVNAAPGRAKSALLFGCVCGQDADEDASDTCMAHGLRKRTRLFFGDEESVSVDSYA
ncbi:MAG TPA: adenylate/guanylate cyclase domain-containing protein [Micromonosporaceae bacterium]|nr:adenylate/guanylate cyclase domain-containing protein [Micromonosporaceae bacterium]